MYLIYSLPLFVILNKTFLAYAFIRTVFLPVSGLILAYFLGRELLKGRYLLLFLFISSLYSTLNFESIRHLVAELGLVLTILGIAKGDDKKVFRGSIFMGLAIMAGIEYAIISIIALSFFVIWHIYLNRKETKFKLIIKAYSGMLAAVVLFFGFLAVKGALKNYFLFFKEFSGSFFYLSPCRSGFPKFDKNTFSSFTQFRRLNLYFLPFMNLAVTSYLFLKRKTFRMSPLLISLLLFTGMAYVRTMINPCLNTMAYGAALFLLVIIYILQKETKDYTKLTISATLVWFTIFSAPNGFPEIINLLRSKNTVETAYVETAGINLDKEKADLIAPVVEYIKENTNEGDYVYVYPYGPYNQLTRTKPATSVIISTHFELAPFLVPKVIEDLERNKPEYVVVNRVNAWGYLAAMSMIPQSMTEYGDVPIFVADLTDVEKYISQNYYIDRKFEQIWVLKRRDTPAEYIPPYVKKEVSILKRQNKNYEEIPGNGSSRKYFITGPNPENVYVIDSLKDVNLAKFPIRAGLGIFRYTSQYLVQVYLLTLDGTLLDKRADILSNDWQELWMEIRKDERLEKGALIIVNISNNRGFFSLGGSPRSIEIKDPEFFEFNQLLKKD